MIKITPPLAKKLSFVAIIWLLGTILLPSCVVAQTGDCEALFLSEYIDGSGGDKALEIFNPTTDEIDLKDYFIGIYHNGSSSPTIVELTGTIAAKDVYVVAYSDCSSRMYSVADQLSDAYFPNGNDAIALLDVDANVLDVIGEIGVDPGSGGWAVANDAGYPFLVGSTDDHTLVRIPYALNAESDWTIAEHEWVALPMDTLHFLGEHLCPCRNSQMYTVRFTSVTPTAWLFNKEEDDCISYSCMPLTIEVSPQINTVGDEVTVTVVPNSTCPNPKAVLGLDYQIFDAFGTPGVTTITLSYFTLSSYDFWLEITDDLLPEPDEHMCVTLQSADATLGSPHSLSTMILDNDMVGLGDKLQLPEFQIRPNPASDKLIMINHPGVGDFRIVNLLGQEYEPESSFIGMEKSIQLGNIPAGLYTLRFTYKGENYAHKFIKE